MMRKTMLGACAGLALTLVAGASGAAANFGGDVNTAINRGLAYLESDGAFTGYPACGGTYQEPYVRGLALLALLEKRATGNLADPPQGYNGASADDKAKMRKAVSCILYSVKGYPSFEAYYYGNWLMGLALYARTGGPGKGATDIPNDAALSDLSTAINDMTDRTLLAQSTTAPKMWGYSGGGDDSSTTQFAAAGLAGAKAYYLSVGDPGSRVAKINTALAGARTAYATYSKTGSDNGSCSVVSATERGFGYHSYYTPSLQQTASGLWVQLLGGADVNDPSVQAYLEWLRNHYRWQDLDSMGNSWPGASYWYYMWSSMKGLLTIEESKITPNAGNLGAGSFGLLAPDGTCTVRQLRKDPATVVRNAVFGPDSPGFYAEETASTYFDYATEILSHQCANGTFACNNAPSSWGPSYYGMEWDRTAWALLVLQRATGGACADANNDGKCDGQDEGAGGLLCDANLDGNVTTSDLNAVYAIVKSKYPVAVPVTEANAWANYNTSGASATKVDINDFWQCYYVGRGMLPKKYYGGVPD